MLITPDVSAGIVHQHLKATRSMEVNPAPVQTTGAPSRMAVTFSMCCAGALLSACSALSLLIVDDVSEQEPQVT